MINFLYDQSRNEMVRLLEENRMQWHLSLGIDRNSSVFTADNLAHYANAACDIEFSFHLVKG